jgi:hypothetical protein
VDWINRLVAFTARVANDKPRIKIIGVTIDRAVQSSA